MAALYTFKVVSIKYTPYFNFKTHPQLLRKETCHCSVNYITTRPDALAQEDSDQVPSVLSLTCTLHPSEEFLLFIGFPVFSLSWLFCPFSLSQPFFVFSSVTCAPPPLGSGQALLMSPWAIVLEQKTALPSR